MIHDIVYIFADKCSLWRNNELKYSLRSLEKHGKNYGKVFIIGDKPNYLNDRIIHIPKEESQTHCKERRIMEKLLVACETPEISEQFIMFNDDYFLTKEIDFKDLPYYYQDDLKTKAALRQKKDVYYYSLINTDKALEEKNYNTLHFDIHYPIIYDKTKFKEVMNSYDWDVRNGYVVKSLYANTLKIDGVFKKDAKIYLSHSRNEIMTKIQSTDLFSTDHITRAMIITLQDLYPYKSKYEN